MKIRKTFFKWNLKDHSNISTMLELKTKGIKITKVITHNFTSTINKRKWEMKAWAQILTSG